MMFSIVTYLILLRNSHAYTLSAINCNNKAPMIFKKIFFFAKEHQKEGWLRWSETWKSTNDLSNIKLCFWLPHVFAT